MNTHRDRMFLVLLLQQVCSLVLSFHAPTNNQLPIQERRTIVGPVHATDDTTACPIPILYESDRILIVNKPTGISHHNHNDNKGEQPGIVTLLRLQQNQRLWGVHRLDRVTSGILVLAKDVEMAQQLTKCFAEQEISKVYIGISAKRPTKKKQGWVQGGMKRSRDKSWKLIRTTTKSSSDGTSKNFAKTRFFSAPIQWHGHKLTCILFRPYTGKTHQLRVAAKAMGIPLLGDPIYKDGGVGSNSNGVEDFDGVSLLSNLTHRTFLHAAGISIPELKGHAAVSIWNLPPFDDIWEQEASVVEELLRKRCDVPEILSAMEGSAVEDAGIEI